jgi:LEA14-like dessication related protein
MSLSRNVKILMAIGAAIAIPGGFIIGASIIAMKKICYKVSGFNMLSIDTKNIKFELLIKVKNPSKINIQIQGYDFNVKINNVQVAKINNSTKKTLIPQQVSEIAVPIDIDVNAIFGAVKSKEIILNFLSRKLDKISLTLEGKFIGEMAKIPIKKDVSINYTLQEVLDESKKPSMPCDLKV